MKKAKIICIGIDKLERLFIKPKKYLFPDIYRAAMEINWDEDKKVLYSPKPRVWTYKRWFQQILNAVETECGITLVIDKKTNWENIKQEIKTSILNEEIINE